MGIKTTDLSTYMHVASATNPYGNNPEGITDPYGGTGTKTPRIDNNELGDEVIFAKQRGASGGQWDDLW